MWHRIEGRNIGLYVDCRSSICCIDSFDPRSSSLQTQQLYNRTLKITRDLLEPHAQECVEFAQAIVDGAPSPVPAEQSLQVMAILDGIYRSQRAGGEVRLE